MNIGINAVGFIPGEMGGMETYFRKLIHFMQRIEDENTYLLLCDEWTMNEFPLNNDRYKAKICNYRKPSFKRLIRSALRKTIGVDILRAEPRYLNLDIVHHPFTTIRPEWRNKPSVLTFLDMQQEFYPEFFTPATLNFRKENYKLSVDAATRVIAISRHVKQCLVDYYETPENKIDVVYLGCGPEFRVIDDREALQRIAVKYSLSENFIYYPAATWPHKNHLALLSAIRLMKDRWHFKGELVLSGIPMQNHEAILTEIERMHLSSSVKVLGYIPHEDLPYLYNLATIMAFPSLFEGFGIPLVEAMACGCPIVCSGVTSIPEVVGDAGVMFDPTSFEDMAEKIWDLWNDQPKMSLMKTTGLERSGIFNWNETARKTLEVYHKAHS